MYGSTLLLSYPSNNDSDTYTWYHVRYNGSNGSRSVDTRRSQRAKTERLLVIEIGAIYIAWEPWELQSIPGINPIILTTTTFRPYLSISSY